MGVEPGDRVLFSFDVASRNALITYDIARGFVTRG
jgi:hypothetical protein